jgi:hypothetical protein
MKRSVPYWPDEEDQAICQRFMRQGGSEGYGMCYLFGFYRHAGLSREAARAKVCEAMIEQGEQP